MGAQAFSSFDTFLAPFVRNDKLTYKQVKQDMQQFIFMMNIASRWGQTPFTNLTMDLTCPDDLKDYPVIIGGEMSTTQTYGQFQPEMDMINKAFLEVMAGGDKDGRIFTFPIPTYNITREFDFESELATLLFEVTGKYGVPNFQNFVNSDLNPSDTRSMCCRLQLDKRELRNRGGGGLFGAGEQTGSLGVCTLNLPRIGYLSQDENEFFNRLDNLMNLAKDALEIRRKVVTENFNNGLMPYSKIYLENFNTYFNTIGLVGMNECCLNFLGESIASEEGHAFAIKVLDYMRERMKDYQEETGNLYNLEATPAEGTSFRLANLDKKLYPDIITAGSSTPYYTNSTHLPVNYTDDIFEALDIEDDLQKKYTGGTMFHGFIGERIENPKAVGELVKAIAFGYKLPFFTITPTYSICPEHGYISGWHDTCPMCK